MKNNNMSSDKFSHIQQIKVQFFVNYGEFILLIDERQIG